MVEAGPGTPSTKAPASAGPAPTAGPATGRADEPPPLEMVPSGGRIEFTAELYASDVKELKNIGAGSFGAAVLIELGSSGERFVSKKIGLEHLAEEEQVKAQNEAALLNSRLSGEQPLVGVEVGVNPLA